MTRWLKAIAGAAVMTAVAAGAFTTTSRLGLQVPAHDEANWDVPLISSLNRIDQFACFPGVACGLNLSTDTASTALPLSKLTDDDGLAGRCLLSGGPGADPAYGPCTSGASMSSFVAGGDSGTPQTVTDGTTLAILGGTGITTAASATRNVTVTFAANELGSLAWGTGSPFTWTFQNGGTNVALDISSGVAAWTANNGFNINGLPAVTTALAQTLTNKTFDGNSNDLSLRRTTGSARCDAFTDGVDGEPCYQKTDDTFWVCETADTVCDTAGEWKAAGGGGVGGSGDITDVWGCTTGNCNALTGAAGDSIDGASADSTKPCKRGTVAARPGTCTDGECYFATDASGGAKTFDCESAAWVQRVAGPASSTNTGIATYTGTTGKQFASSTCTILNGNLTCPGWGNFSSTGSSDAVTASMASPGDNLFGAVDIVAQQTDDANAGDRTVGLLLGGISTSNDADSLTLMYAPPLTAPNGAVTESVLEIGGNYDYGVVSGSRISVSTPSGATPYTGTSTENTALTATTSSSATSSVSATLNVPSNAATNTIGVYEATLTPSADAADVLSAYRAKATTSSAATVAGLYVEGGYDYGVYTADGVPSRIGGCTFDGVGSIDCLASPTVGGQLTLREPSVLGSSLFQLKIPDATGLTSSGVHVINADGTLPATAVETAVGADKGKLVRFNSASGVVEAITTPTTCGAGDAAAGIDANGNATGCFTPSGGGGGGGGAGVPITVGFGTGMLLPAGSGTSYLGLGTLVDTTENIVSVPGPATTFRNLRCVSSATPGGTLTVTMRHGSCGSLSPDAGFSVTLTTANAPVLDTDTVTTSANDCVSFAVARTSTTAATAVNCTVEASSGQILGFGSGMLITAGTTTRYSAPGTFFDATESNVQVPSPTAQYKNLRCVSSATPGGSGIVVTGRLGTCGALANDTSVSSDGVLTVTLTTANTAVADTTNTMAVTSPQCISFGIATSGTSTAAAVSCTVERVQ